MRKIKVISVVSSGLTAGILLVAAVLAESENSRFIFLVAGLIGLGVTFWLIDKY